MAAVASYRTLGTNSRYLRSVAFDAGPSGLTADDRKDAERQAAVEIEMRLARAFSAPPNTPPVISLLGDLLGSAILFEYMALSLSFGKDGEGARKPDFLRKKADKIFEDLRAHKIGVQNLDGSFDALYPSPSVLPLVALGDAKNITVDPGLTWGQMAQGVITDDEKRALDDSRGRRANDLEAALAGAYGV